MILRFPAAIAVIPPAGYLTDLSDHGRSPIAEERDERSVKVELANGNMKKYIKAIKKKWTMDWQWLPDQDADTVDGKAGRETLRSMFQSNNSGKTFSLLFRDTAASGGTGVRTYTVFVDSYSDDLIRRDTVGNRYFFNVKVTFVEQ